MCVIRDGGAGEFFDRTCSASEILLYLIVGREGLKLGGAKDCHKGGPRPSIQLKHLALKKVCDRTDRHKQPAKKSTRHEVSLFCRLTLSTLKLNQIDIPPS
jgi:hypothetical protein